MGSINKRRVFLLRSKDKRNFNLENRTPDVRTTLQAGQQFETKRPTPAGAPSRRKWPTFRSPQTASIDLPTLLFSEQDQPHHLPLTP